MTTSEGNSTATQQWSGSFESVPLGAEERVERMVEGRTIDLFADAVQSFHPIHMSLDWVREHTTYPNRIAHGLLTSALMSRPIVNFCERYAIKSVLVSSSAKYVRPVFAGDPSPPDPFDWPTADDLVSAGYDADIVERLPVVHRGHDGRPTWHHEALPDLIARIEREDR